METSITIGLGVLGLLLAAGCAPAAGAEPSAMSADEHTAVAQREQRVAEEHAARWTSQANPTARQLKEAERHRRLATQHRAASEALLTAEARACAGIPERDRDMSPFAHRDAIRSVAPLSQADTGKVALSPNHTGSTGSSADGPSPKNNRRAGAIVVFAAHPGMTAEWLQRVVDCHRARNAAIGYEAASTDMPYCPLAVRGARARVESVGDGFAVSISASEPTSVNEIVRLAEMLRSEG